MTDTLAERIAGMEPTVSVHGECSYEVHMQICAIQKQLAIAVDLLRQYNEATTWLLGGEPIDTLMVEARANACQFLAALNASPEAK